MAQLSPERWCLCLLDAPSRWRRVNVEPGPLRADRVRVDFRYCGICGSDLSAYEGRRNTSYPASFGHEFVGVVRAVGADVANLIAGDVVISDLNHRCGICDYCNEGKSHLCVTGQKGDFSNRAFASSADLASSYLFKIAVNEPLPQHALIEPLSCVLHAIDRAKVQITEKVLLLGAGSLGSCFAFAWHCRPQSPRLFIHDQNDVRLTRVLGQATSAAAAPSDVAEQYDVVFDLTGSMEGLRRACSSVRRGGRVISMSHLDWYGSADFLLPYLTRTDVWFTVSYLNGEIENLRSATDLILTRWQGGWNTLLDVRSWQNIEHEFARRRVSDHNKTVLKID